METVKNFDFWFELLKATFISAMTFVLTYFYFYYKKLKELDSNFDKSLLAELNGLGVNFDLNGEMNIDHQRKVKAEENFKKIYPYKSRFKNQKIQRKFNYLLESLGEIYLNPNTESFVSLEVPVGDIFNFENNITITSTKSSEWIQEFNLFIINTEYELNRRMIKFIK